MTYKCVFLRPTLPTLPTHQYNKLLFNYLKTIFE